MTSTDPARIVKPLSWPCDVELTLPGSKSEANRMLVAAALSGRNVTIEGATACDDVRHLVNGLRTLGFHVDWADEANGKISVGPRRASAPRRGELFCGNAGTALRFLVSLAAITRGDWTLTGDARMQRRPVGPLVDAWRQLGAEITDVQGFPPVCVRGGPREGGRVRLDPSLSSQYLSSLLLTGSQMARGLDIEFTGPVASAEYARWTCDLLSQFGVKAELHSGGAAVRHGNGAGPGQLTVGGDWSAMGVWTCLSHLTGSTVRGVNLRQGSGQADEGLGRHLTTLEGTGERTVDVSAVPDQFMNLAVVAARRQGITRLVNAANLRAKECDRIAVTARELRRIGVKCDEQADGLLIEGVKSLRPATIDPEGDHRIAMAFALAGLLSPGISIDNPGCVAKSYPTFWEDLERVRSATRCVAVMGEDGAGVALLAQSLAARTGRIWLDTGMMFEERFGPSEAYVKRKGWSAFRDAEARLVKEAAAPGRVVSFGAGAIESPETRAILRERFLVVCLDGPVARLCSHDRLEPSLAPGTDPGLGAAGDESLARRIPLYTQVSTVRIAAELETEVQVEQALTQLAASCQFPGEGGARCGS